jgi:uncharacterized coiled-coil protein SlyX
MATQSVHLERTVEARIARLESHVEHIQSDITEIKSDVLRLDQKLDQKFDSLRDSLTKLTVWALTLYCALAASLLGVMAKGFGWIK